MSLANQNYLSPSIIKKIDNLYLRAKLVVEGFIVGFLNINIKKNMLVSMKKYGQRHMLVSMQVNG